jgi:ATP-binding cassette subfamily B protein/ATP-binding cassette subfamily C protein
MRELIAVIAQDDANWPLTVRHNIAMGRTANPGGLAAAAAASGADTMDEPTAALDARAESALFSSVREHAKGRSLLLITHRMASVRHADRIYVLRDGRVIEQGRHAELMELGGQYAELYTLQAAQYG